MSKKANDAGAYGCLFGLGFLGALIVLGYWSHWTLAVATGSLYLIVLAVIWLIRERRARKRRTGGLSILARAAGLWHLTGEPPAVGNRAAMSLKRVAAARRGLEFTDEEWGRLQDEQESFWRWYYEQLPEEEG